MGILNVTPDSFYNGSRFEDDKAILAQTEKMLLEGAAIIDVGGYSTRPGARDIPEEDELARVIPAIRCIIRNFPGAAISIDTFRSRIAEAAIGEGALLINDVSGGSDERMFGVAGSFGVPYVLMHMRGTPQTMSAQTIYDHLIKDLMTYFQTRISDLHSKGVKDIIIDPGFGFAKTASQSFDLLQHLDHFKFLGLPILAGLSRKSMIWKTLGVDAEKALNGTTTLNTIALLKGASLLRVHDVKEAVEVIKLIEHLPHAGSASRSPV